MKCQGGEPMTEGGTNLKQTKNLLTFSTHATDYDQAKHSLTRIEQPTSS